MSGVWPGMRRIDDGVDVLLERADVRGAERRKDGTLRAALGNILVLEVLGRGERVVLVQEGPLVDRILPGREKCVSVKSE